MSRTTNKLSRAWSIVWRVVLAFIITAFLYFCFFPVELIETEGRVTKMYTSYDGVHGTAFNGVIDTVGSCVMDRLDYETLQEGRRYKFILRRRGYAATSAKIMHFEPIE